MDELKSSTKENEPKITITVEEVIDHPKMKDYLQNWIDSYHIARRKDPGKGLKYKRNVIDELIEKDLFNPDSLKASFMDILAKRSPLSSRMRDAIHEIIMIAARKVLENIYNDKKETDGKES